MKCPSSHEIRAHNFLPTDCRRLGTEDPTEIRSLGTCLVLNKFLIQHTKYVRNPPSGGKTGKLIHFRLGKKYVTTIIQLGTVRITREMSATMTLHLYGLVICTVKNQFCRYLYCKKPVSKYHPVSLLRIIFFVCGRNKEAES